MRYYFLLIAIGLFISSGQAQVSNPVRWKKEIVSKGAGLFELLLSAHIEPGWHIYSKDSPEGGPVASSVDFVQNPLIIWQEPLQESGKMEIRDEPLFNVSVKQYSNHLVFTRKFKLRKRVNTSIAGSIRFMSCNDHECLPPTAESFKIEW